MECPSCRKEVVADRVFCIWCASLIPAPRTGTKAGVGRRLWAAVLDGAVWAIIYVLLIALGMSGSGGAVISLLVSLALVVWAFYLFAHGQTLGKMLAGIQVVDAHSGRPAGFWRMLGREIIGKFVSGFFLSLGFFWALWDKDSQAWHDKMFGTVVVRRAEVRAAAPAPA